MSLCIISIYYLFTSYIYVGTLRYQEFINKNRMMIANILLFILVSCFFIENGRGSTVKPSSTYKYQ